MSDNVKRALSYFATSGAEEFCQHDFSINLHHSGPAWFFPRVQGTLQLAMSEVESYRKTCLDRTIIYSGLG